MKVRRASAQTRCAAQTGAWVRDAFRVRYTEAARDDLLRLSDALLARAHTVEDLDAAQIAIDTFTAEVESRLSVALRRRARVWAYIPL